MGTGPFEPKRGEGVLRQRPLFELDCCSRSEWVRSFSHQMLLKWARPLLLFLDNFGRLNGGTADSRKHDWVIAPPI